MKTLKAIPYQQGTLFVDEQAKIKETGDFVTYHGTPYRTNHSNLRNIITDEWVCVPNNLTGCKKIIAQHNLNFEGIPYVELEEDVDCYSRKQVYAITYSVWYDMSDDPLKSFEKHILNQTPQLKKYTQNDLINAFMQGAINSKHCLENKPFINAEQYIQSLQPKIESIEVDTTKPLKNKVVVSGGVLTHFAFAKDEPVTYQKDGKTYLKVKKINYAD